ncbi:MAG: hypothetical protein AAF363_13520 [Bacteroidota bacterium]
MDLKDYKSQQEYWKNEASKYEEEISKKFEEVVGSAKKILGIGLVSGIITCVVYYLLRDKTPDIISEIGNDSSEKRFKTENSRYKHLVKKGQSEIEKFAFVLILSAIRKLLAEFLERLNSEENTQHLKEE